MERPSAAADKIISNIHNIFQVPSLNPFGEFDRDLALVNNDKYLGTLNNNVKNNSTLVAGLCSE